MTKLTAVEEDGLYRAVQAEYESKSAAADVLQRFGSVAVFEHLHDSAARHIAVVCETLHSYDAEAPVLAPVPDVHNPTLVDALKAATERETRTAAIYDEVLHHTNKIALKRVLLPLWQSISHLHLVAIADQLGIEEVEGQTSQEQRGAL